MSRVYRFHGPADLLVPDRPILLRKRKNKMPERFHLIGADASLISDLNGTQAIETYAAGDARAVTLTRREADLIALANPGVESPAALEDLYPWLPECRFLNDSMASLRAAEAIIRRFGQHLISPSSFCDEKWNTICNALRQRSIYDARFYSAWHLPIQEAYVLEEVRPNRCVVAIDFNGMYPSCMQQCFPKPSALHLVQLRRDFDPSEILTTGLYRCVLHERTSDFIIRHNPFRSFHSGRHLRARLNEPVAIDLNEFELSYFSRHFRRIYLLEAIISDETVAHPLAKEARRSFARRKNYRNQRNKTLADREKFLATLMTSCASRPSRPTRTFKSQTAAMAHVQSYYGIDVPIDEPEAATDIWLDGRRGVTLDHGSNGTKVRGPDLRNGSACHLLGQRIVARGRIMLLEMMERILVRAPNVQICYANIDSIHFSLPTSHLDDVIAWLECEASDAMGSFKIEVVTQHGLWLEPGRYWLYSEKDVVKFKNRSVGDQQQPFKDHAIHVASRRIGDLDVPVRMTLNMEHTMSPLCSIQTGIGDGLSHQRLIEVGDSTTFLDVISEIEHNQCHAIPARMAAFKDLSRQINSSRNAASVREDSATVMCGRRPPARGVFSEHSPQEQENPGRSCA
ncbi:hypothetical protein CP98_00004 [Sphingobium yanoikuyae]|uniref:Uncharacterized protein n=1 Tax=Sphingobium yanoikuyae TaxID=13690 RepID=A0A084ETN5_SPHYA|nr:hypothetical protein [Sphingobium yanoikuyae]KEZ21327.1 hypothetical protein CP98_00004 [Sphingobium yanoikuyae]